MTRLPPILAALILCACTKQPVPVAAPASAPPAPSAPSAPTVFPAETVFVSKTQEVCRQVRDGNTIARLQGAAEKLMTRVQSDPGYGGAWFDHSPCYRIVYAFIDGKPRQWVIDAAEPELRPYIAFARTRYSLSGREIARREITTSLNSAGVRIVFLDAGDGTGFGIVVKSESHARLARSVIPTRYLPAVRISVGDIEPRPE